MRRAQGQLPPLQTKPLLERVGYGAGQLAAHTNHVHRHQNGTLARGVLQHHCFGPQFRQLPIRRTFAARVARHPHGLLRSDHDFGQAYVPLASRFGRDALQRGEESRQAGYPHNEKSISWGHDGRSWKEIENPMATEIRSFRLSRSPAFPKKPGFCDVTSRTT